MFRIAKKKFSRLAASFPQTNLFSHLNTGKFSSSILKDGEYIEGETNSSQNHKQEKKREIKKNFVDLTRLKNSLEHGRPQPSTRPTKSSINDSYKSVMKKFKFEVAEEEPEEIKNIYTSSSLQTGPSSKTKSSTQKKLNEIKSKNEQKLSGLLSSLKKVDNKEEKEIVQELPSRKNYYDIKKNSEQSHQTLKEYFKGEEGVDILHIDPSKLSAVPDLVDQMTREVFAGAEQQKGKKYPEGLINSWRDNLLVQRDYNFTNTSEVKEYPGSSKGPHPEDDPEYFADWYVNNLTAETKELMMNKAKEARKEANESAELSTEHIIQSDIANQEIAFSFPEDSMAASGMTINYYSHYEPWEISPLPDTMTNDPQQDPEHIEKWVMFRMYPRMSEFLTNYQKMADAAMRMDAGSRPEVIVPTLWRYYQLLPNFAREHPLVKTVFLGLEFTKHRVPLQEKEILLNMACSFLLPFEKWHEEALSEATTSHKYFVPLWEELQLLDEGEGGEEGDANEGEGDGKEEDKKKRREKKKLAAPVFDPERYKDAVKNEDLILNEEWPAPERITDPNTPWDIVPNLPIDFYDNEDGFWTDYIAKKESQYNKLPIVANRRHFKH